MSLTKQASDLEINQLNKSNQLSQQIFVISKLYEDDDMEDGGVDDDGLPNSNLYRDGSSENWKHKLIEKRKQDMTKEMVHLAKLQNMSLTLDEMKPSQD